jgi:uncharacterized RDD family membrane protein YckC
LWREYWGAIGVRVADLGIDLASRMIDMLVVLLIVIGIFGPILYVGSWVQAIGTWIEKRPRLAAVATKANGLRVGKMTVGIKVVGVDGQPPTGGRALLRYVGYALSGLVLSLGFLWVIFDRKRQGWHDKMAGTYVMYSDEEFAEGDRVRVEPADQKPGWAWLVLWVLLALAVPPALVAAVFGLGPYVSRLLVSLFAGGS